MGLTFFGRAIGKRFASQKAGVIKAHRERFSATLFEPWQWAARVGR